LDLRQGVRRQRLQRPGPGRLRPPAARRHDHHGPVRVDEVPEPARLPLLRGPHAVDEPRHRLPAVRPLLQHRRRRPADAQPDDVDLRRDVHLRPGQQYFYANPATNTLAFAPSTATNTAPNGDNFLFANNNASTSYAQTAGGSSTSTAIFLTTDTASQQAFEHDGYQSTKFTSAPSTYNGYTEGPGYYGKTFWVWPPDPREPALATGDPTNAANHANNGAKDWRQRFFFKVKSGTNNLEWLDDNSVLFNSSGYIQIPGTATATSVNGTSYNYTYRVNYAAILNWLRNISPTHFPTSMLTGRIQYWSDIPDPTSSTYTGMTGGLNQYFWTTADSGLTNNERFWRGYIDWVLGLQNNGLSSGLLTYTTDDGSNRWSTYIGPGETFTWGTVSIHAVPWRSSGTINNTGGYAAGTSSTINVSGFTTSNIAVGNYVKFGLDPTTYLVSALATSGTTVTSITLSTTTPYTGLANAVANGAQVRVYTSYMNYADNPRRPRHHFWFGPLTFIDYTGNYNMGQHWWPGNITEAQAWACKAGIQTAIDDISNNHPNDYVGLTFFSTPIYSNGGSGPHNRAVVPLGRNYQNLKDSLWFPPTTVTGGVSSVTPYDPDFDQVPRANGGTTPEMGFLITYNMFSSSVTNLRLYSQPTSTYKGFAGGMGRKGASRLVIFETDGVPNTEAQATLAGSGSDSYYPIRVYNPSNMGDPNNVEWPKQTSGSYANSQVFGIVTQICAQTTANPPGYSTPRKQAQVWCIGYGSIYDPSGPGATSRNNGMTFLRGIMYNSGTAPGQTGSNFPDSLLVYGTSSQRVTRMQTAFTQIMQSEVQVSLLQ
jgi:hypothetical protein